MRESVHSAAVNRSQIRGKYHAVTTGILLEKQKLGVIRKSGAVIQIDVYKGVIVASASKAKKLLKKLKIRGKRGVDHYPASDHVAKPAMGKSRGYGT